jgi:hypothetical protein
MIRGLRRSLPVVVAVVATAGLTLGGPAIARTAAAGDADTLDGRPGVGCSATLSARAGAYVATCASGPQKGRLPNDIIRRAPDAAKLAGRTAGDFDDARTLDGLDSADFQRAPAGPQFFAISGMDLIGVNDTAHGVFPPGSPSGGDYCATYGNGINFVDAFAPVLLPDGAVITALQARYLDNGSSSEPNGVVKLVRTPFGSGTFRELLTANLTNTGSQGELATADGVITGGTTTRDLTIDRAKYMYDVVLDEGTPNGPVCGLRITYSD